MKIEIQFNKMEEAISVMREVAAWGREQGYRVWPDEWLTPEELTTPDAQPENFCVGTLGGETACAFILQWTDADYWLNAPKYEAAYLHKFCVRRPFAGMGMTKLVVDAIKEECCRRGVRYIRLDTGLDEKVVRKIYLNAGFKIVDIIDYPNGRSMALYEMEVKENNMTIKRIDCDSEKKTITRTILEALPDWFGIPEAREEYIADSVGKPFFSAYEGDSPVGFLYLKETGRHTVKLAVMGVLKEYHRSGIGRKLFEEAKDEAKHQGYSFIQVKTVQMGRYDIYDDTNRFYLSLGFKELEVFPTLWDECNPCQIYIMAI